MLINFALLIEIGSRANDLSFSLAASYLSLGDHKEPL